MTLPPFPYSPLPYPLASPTRQNRRCSTTVLVLHWCQSSVASVDCSMGHGVKCLPRFSRVYKPSVLWSDAPFKASFLSRYLPFVWSSPAVAELLCPEGVWVVPCILWRFSVSSYQPSSTSAASIFSASSTPSASELRCLIAVARRWPGEILILWGLIRDHVEALLIPPRAYLTTSESRVPAAYDTPFLPLESAFNLGIAEAARSDWSDREGAKHTRALQIENPIH